jgi:hypothetical protein
MSEPQPASTPQNREGKTRPSLRVWQWLVILTLLCAGVYLCDYLWVRYRIAKNRNPFGVVNMRRYYAIPQKSGKTELVFQEPEDQVCVQSLFPHFGYSPCWYAKRNNVKRIDM